MNEMLRHEIPFRGEGTIRKISGIPIYLMGCGAIGSNLAVTLAKQGFQDLHVFDMDRVEGHNLGTQTYNIEDIGSLKVDALKTQVYYAAGVDISVEGRRVTTNNIRSLTTGVIKSGILVDCFDNSESRGILFNWAKEKKIDCVHAGFNGAYAEIRWNEVYTVPSNAGEDICDYPLARNLVTLLVSVLAETIVRFIATNEKINSSITFNDLKIHRDLC